MTDTQAAESTELTPCLYSCPTATIARVRFAAILTRSQFFLMSVAVLPVVLSLNIRSISHGSLTENAPSGKEGAAFDVLMKEKARLQALLPSGWEKDFTTFFSLDGNVLMSLMAFCTACSVDGVQTRDMGHTTRSPLDTLETALGFHLRDWWHPTKENYFSGLKHPQIVASLKEAGLTGAAGDAEKMKKGDAADHAQFHLKDTRWVPAWLKGPSPVADAPADEHTTDTETSTDNDTTAHAA